MKLRGYIGHFVGCFIWIDSDFYPADQAGSFFNGYLFYRFFFSAIMVGGYLIYSRQNFRINKKKPYIGYSGNMLCPFFRISVYRI
jgi:hypothetical protein